MTWASPAVTLSFAVAAGMVGQTLARHLRVPGIIVLLALGVVLGPDLANVVVPATLGSALQIIVGFAVAVILFEGGLALDFGRLRRQQRPIRQLVTIGALVTLVGGTLGARLLIGWPWRIAVLFGALVVVTGPTVVTPLVRRLRVRRRVATILEAEGLLIDAIGAVLAAFVLEVAIEPTSETLARALYASAMRIGVGGAIGLGGGLLLVALLRGQRFVPTGLENTFVLAVAWALFFVCNAIVHESGIAAVTVAGLVVGNGRTRVHHELREFKEQLTVMLIGMLFVLLAADVRLAEVLALGRNGIWLVASLILVVRPLSVWIGTLGCRLGWRQRLFIGWIGPRGIVAAAIASLFSAELSEAGLPAANELRALVFLVIAVTVVVAGATGGIVARLLKQRQPQSGWVVAGAHELARALVAALDQRDDTVMIDTNHEHCKAATEQGMAVLEENALDDRTLEVVRIETRLGAIGLSTNEEINMLFAQRVRRETKQPQLFLARGEGTVTREMLDAVGAEVLFGGTTDVGLWDARLRRGLVQLMRCKTEGDVDAAALAEAGAGPLLLLVVQDGARALPVGDKTKLPAGTALTVAVYLEQQAEARAVLERFGVRQEPPEPEAS